MYQVQWNQLCIMDTLGQYWVILEKLRRFSIVTNYLGIMVLSLLKKFFLVFCIFTILSPPNCIDIHIKCLVRLEVTHRPNLPEVTNTGIYIAQYYLGTNHKCPDYQGVLIFQVNSYDKAVLL